MKPAQIVIPNRPKAVSNYYDRLDRPKARGRPFSYVFRDSTGNELKRPAVQGFAVLHERIFEYDGRLVYFKPDAFIATQYDGKSKDLLLDHKTSQRFGGTDTGLEFAHCLQGLAFRMPLDGVNGRTIYENVMSNDRACVSVGCTITDSVIKKICGYDVEIVSKASLREISLCYQGAVPETFAEVVDLDNEEKMLWLAARSTSFATSKLVSNATAAARRIADNIKLLR